MFLNHVLVLQNFSSHQMILSFFSGLNKVYLPNNEKTAVAMCSFIENLNRNTVRFFNNKLGCFFRGTGWFNTIDFVIILPSEDGIIVSLFISVKSMVA